MKSKIYVYGNSEIALRTKNYLKDLGSFDVDSIASISEEKHDGLIINFLDNITFKEVLTLSQDIRKSENKIISIFPSSNDEVILGTTYLSKGSSCIDSTIGSLLKKTKQFSSEEELLQTKVPSFNNILLQDFYLNTYTRILSNLLKEINAFFSEKITSYFYVNQVEVFPLDGGKSKIDFISPIFEQRKATNNVSFDKDLKITLTDFLNAKRLSRFVKFNKNKEANGYKNIGVIGGGTAGYLTAIALKRKYPELEVTLVESKKIPIIGVGEATTPIIKNFLFNELGINKLDFFKVVKPTWKLGIKFFWGLPEEYYFNYPFGKTDLLTAYMNGNINECSFNSVLMSNNSSFVFKQDEEKHMSLSRNISYAYHLDNKKFVEYLQLEAEKIGVLHKDLEIESVVPFQDKEGIDYLKSKEGEVLKFEFYADCTGFKSLLMEKGLASKYVSYKSSLFTDRAIVGSVPHEGVIKPYTSADTMENGWCWNIPVREHDHVGYVHSSEFCSEEKALKEMKSKYPKMGEHRVVKFKSGRHEHFIKSNVVAIGNAYGFVEPLESTGIHMIITEIQSFRDNFKKLKNDESQIVRGILNEDMNNRWDYLRWFLAIHYKFNKKSNSDFWKECRENVDVSGFNEILDIYKKLGPLEHTGTQVKNRLNKEISDNLFGLFGIDNILMGQGVVSENINQYRIVNKKLWNQNVATWNELAATSVDLKEDIFIINNNPELLK